MTEGQKPAPPRMIHLGGLSHREERMRMECLRMAADAGGTSNQILARAEAMARHIEEAPTELARNNRWTCLRMASQMENALQANDDIVRIALDFEGFIYGTATQTPA